ncbi:calcium-binding protein, partial [Halomonas sp. 707D4]|uniref:calcium-binding protein n=1 Tax=Halomonas sp. 707D4 TaxID=1904455 RepID=UPI0026469C5A
DKAPGNLGSQAALSERWLDSRAEAALIDVRSLTFSAEAPLNSPIVLRGEPGTSTSSAFKAFIIDTTGLPGGARIVLEHIDFVSLKGSATLVGGAGESVIIGDDAPLNLTLGEGRAIVVGGAGDDVLIGGAGDSYLEGGEGSNRFYTKAGNDTLVGGSDVDVVRFDAAMDEVSITRDDAGRLVVSGEGNGRNTLTGVELLRFDDRVVLVDAPSLADDTIVLFDEAFYLRQNADVAEAVARGEYASGQAHFERFGAGEGREASDTTRNANLAFDEEFYLAHNPDVAAAIASGVFASAFEHYSRFGEQEGRNPNVLFDERAYRAANADVDAAIEQGIFDSAYLHYRLFGEGEGRAPSAWFDLAAYQAANPDVVA